MQIEITKNEQTIVTSLLESHLKWIETELNGNDEFIKPIILSLLEKLK